MRRAASESGLAEGGVSLSAAEVDRLMEEGMHDLPLRLRRLCANATRRPPRVELGGNALPGLQALHREGVLRGGVRTREAGQAALRRRAEGERSPPLKQQQQQRQQRRVRRSTKQLRSSSTPSLPRPRHGETPAAARPRIVLGKEPRGNAVKPAPLVLVRGADSVYSDSSSALSDDGHPYAAPGTRARGGRHHSRRPSRMPRAAPPAGAGSHSSSNSSSSSEDDGSASEDDDGDVSRRRNHDVLPGFDYAERRAAFKRELSMLAEGGENRTDEKEWKSAMFPTLVATNRRELFLLERWLSRAQSLLNADYEALTPLRYAEKARYVYRQCATDFLREEERHFPQRHRIAKRLFHSYDALASVFLKMLRTKKGIFVHRLQKRLAAVEDERDRAFEERDRAEEARLAMERREQKRLGLVRRLHERLEVLKRFAFMKTGRLELLPADLDGHAPDEVVSAVESAAELLPSELYNLVHSETAAAGSDALAAFGAARGARRRSVAARARLSNGETEAEQHEREVRARAAGIRVTLGVQLDELEARAEERAELVAVHERTHASEAEFLSDVNATLERELGAGAASVDSFARGVIESFRDRARSMVHSSVQTDHQASAAGGGHGRRKPSVLLQADDGRSAAASGDNDRRPSLAISVGSRVSGAGGDAPPDRSPQAQVRRLKNRGASANRHHSPTLRERSLMAAPRGGGQDARTLPAVDHGIPVFVPAALRVLAARAVLEGGAPHDEDLSAGGVAALSMSVLTAAAAAFHADERRGRERPSFSEFVLSFFLRRHDSPGVAQRALIDFLVAAHGLLAAPGGVGAAPHVRWLAYFTGLTASHRDAALPQGGGGSGSGTAAAAATAAATAAARSALRSATASTRVASEPDPAAEAVCEAEDRERAADAYLACLGAVARQPSLVHMDGSRELAALLALADGEDVHRPVQPATAAPAAEDQGEAPIGLAAESCEASVLVSDVGSVVRLASHRFPFRTAGEGEAAEACGAGAAEDPLEAVAASQLLAHRVPVHALLDQLMAVWWEQRAQLRVMLRDMFEALRAGEEGGELTFAAFRSAAEIVLPDVIDADALRMYRECVTASGPRGLGAASFASVLASQPGLSLDGTREMHEVLVFCWTRVQQRFGRARVRAERAAMRGRVENPDGGDAAGANAARAAHHGATTMAALASQFTAKARQRDVKGMHAVLASAAPVYEEVRLAAGGPTVK